MDIGFKIKILRNEKNVTQDELARAVGISTQAVSKWENGGAPDIELLPRIANFFNVSIDSLFDMEVNYENIETVIENYIASYPTKKERFNVLIELCWKMTLNIPGTNKSESTALRKILDENRVRNTEVTQDEGIALMRIAKEGTFYFAAPKPDNHFNYLLNNQALIINAFKILSNKDTFSGLIFLNSRDNKNFTSDLLVKELGVNINRAEAIIEELKILNFIKVSELELDGEILKTYSLRKNPALIGLLAFINQIVKRPNNFYHYYGGELVYFQK